MDCDGHIVAVDEYESLRWNFQEEWPRRPSWPKMKRKLKESQSIQTQRQYPIGLIEMESCELLPLHSMHVSPVERAQSRCIVVAFLFGSIVESLLPWRPSCSYLTLRLDQSPAILSYWQLISRLQPWYQSQRDSNSLSYCSSSMDLLKRHECLPM